MNLALGGGTSQHPPFRLFPLWVLGTLGWGEPFAFRLQGLIPLGLITYFVYSYSKSILISLAILTLPLLLHSSTIIEFSLWYTAGTVLFISRIEKTTRGDILLDAILVTLFTLIRQPSIALFLFILYKLQVNRDVGFRYILKVALLLAPAFLFVISSIFEGNPAIKNSLEINAIAKNILSSPYLFYRDFPSWSFVFFVGLYFSKHRIFLLIFLISNIVLFSRTGTYGVPRYQIEIFGGIWLYSAVLFFQIFIPILEEKGQQYKAQFLFHLKTKTILMILLTFSNILSFYQKWDTIEKMTIQIQSYQKKFIPILKRFLT